MHLLLKDEGNHGALKKMALMETVQHIIRYDSLLFQRADVAVRVSAKGSLRILMDKCAYFDKLILPLQRLTQAQLSEAYEEKIADSPIQYGYVPDFDRLQCPCRWFRSYRLPCKHLWRLTLEGWHLDDGVVKEMVDSLSDGYMSYYHDFDDPLHNPAFVEAQRAWVDEESMQRALREAEPRFARAREIWLTFQKQILTLFNNAQELAQQLPRGGTFMEALAAYLTYVTLGGLGRINPRRWALERGFLDIGMYLSA